MEAAKLARIALIADEEGEAEVALQVRSNLKEEIVKWFQSSSEAYLIYDSTWGGVVSSKSLIEDPSNDFWNSRYNDHHFHYGYFLYAIAAVGKEDKEFLETYKEEILAIARDIANPSS